MSFSKKEIENLLLSLNGDVEATAQVLAGPKLKTLAAREISKKGRSRDTRSSILKSLAPKMMTETYLFRLKLPDFIQYMDDQRDAVFMLESEDRLDELIRRYLRSKGYDKYTAVFPELTESNLLQKLKETLIWMLTPDGIKAWKTPFIKLIDGQDKFYTIVIKFATDEYPRQITIDGDYPAPNDYTRHLITSEFWDWSILQLLQRFSGGGKVHTFEFFPHDVRTETLWIPPDYHATTIPFVVNNLYQGTSATDILDALKNKELPLSMFDLPNVNFALEDEKDVKTGGKSVLKARMVKAYIDVRRPTVLRWWTEDNENNAAKRKFFLENAVRDHGIPMGSVDVLDPGLVDEILLANATERTEHTWDQLYRYRHLRYRLQTRMWPENKYTRIVRFLISTVDKHGYELERLVPFPEPEG